jgi:hypothetical protein
VTEEVVSVSLCVFRAPPDINVIIGSSVGGFYHLANSLGFVPCSICPAYRNDIRQIPAPLPIKNSSFMRFVLGGRMMSSKQRRNLNFLAQNSNPQTDYDITIKGWRIKFLLIFSNKKQKPFFEQLCY